MSDWNTYNRQSETWTTAASQGQKKKKQKKQPWSERHRRVWKFVTYLKDYCANSTLVGFAYIANQHLHPTERIFWLICVILSSMGCYYLISQYQRDFPIRAVSIVYESVPPFSKVKFPTISVCPLADKRDLGIALDNYVRSLGVGLDEDYNYDVETHVAFMVFPYLYHEGTVRSHCQPYEKCEPCAKCPRDNYRGILNMLGTNCTELFSYCELAGKEFDCCQYFQPLITTFGLCFMLNSLQNNKRNSEHWLPTILDPSNQRAMMKISTQRPMYVTLLNEEDIPHTALTGVGIGINEAGQTKGLQFYIESMENDPDVYDVDPLARKCYFPNELLSWTVYRAYSFSTCISDCAREFQMELCNCTTYTLNPFMDNRFPDCDYAGYMCLESHSMIKPDAKLLFRFKSAKRICNCFPSCDEPDIRTVYESASIFNRSNKARTVILNMPAWPTDQYRRQALRTSLDAVVTVGGMLGLFLGASILSAIEFFYFFTLRAFNTVMQRRQAA